MNGIHIKNLLQCIKNNTINILEINGININAGRLSSVYSRNNLFSDSILSTTEKVVAVSTPLGFDATRPATARILSFASTSTADTSAGTGMRTLGIEGVDTNNDYVFEVITMNGQTEVDSVASFLRINEMFILSAGTGEANAGIIYCSDSTDTFTAGEPQTRVYDIMGAGEGISKVGLYRVPNGQEYYLKNTTISSDSSATKLSIIRVVKVSTSLTTLEIGKAFSSGGVTQLDLSNLGKITAGTDILVLGKSSSGTIDCHISIGVIIKTV